MPIIRGEPSIGFSNFEPPASTLPNIPYFSQDSQEILRQLMTKVEGLKTLVEGKADADKIKTLIQYSDEAIRIQAENIVLIGTVTIGQIIRDQNGSGDGTIPISITQIIGDRIRTGVIVSNNWGPTAGTALDLNNGILILGGADSPSLYFEAGDLTVSGTITANSFVLGGSVPPGTTLEDIFTASIDALTEADLVTGVGNILAGVGNDFVLNVNSSYATFKHKDAIPFGSTGGYSGTLRTALAITANGIGAGYNRKSDGAWQNSVAIDGTTGNATFLGTLTVGSVIAGSVEVLGTSMSDILDGSVAGQDISDKLLVSGTAILAGVIQPNNTGGVRTGTITWNSTTGALTGGTGIAITEWGIIGAASGTPTFTIQASNGNATFAGDITGASGTFSGIISTNSYVYATGGTDGGGGLLPVSSLMGVPSDTSATGVTGKTTSGIGVYGQCGNSSGVGIQGVGLGGGLGGSFSTSGGTALQLSTVLGSGDALNVVSGSSKFNSNRIIKSRVDGHLIKVYDPSTHALLNTFEYSFE